MNKKKNTITKINFKLWQQPTTKPIPILNLSKTVATEPIFWKKIHSDANLGLGLTDDKLKGQSFSMCLFFLIARCYLLHHCHCLHDSFVVLMLVMIFYSLLQPMLVIGGCGVLLIVANLYFPPPFHLLIVLVVSVVIFLLL